LTLADDVRTLLSRYRLLTARSPRKDQFLPFDSTFITPGETPEKVLLEQPNRHPEQYGMFRAVTPSWGLWGPDGQPDEGLCRQLARQYAAAGVTLISPDVEMEWTTAPDPTTLQPFTASQIVAFKAFCKRWIQVIRWMKSETPGVMFDLFAVPPFGTWYLNDTPAVRAERTRRDQMAIDEGLIDVCDVICPEMYTAHPVPESPEQTWDVRQQNWENSLQAITEECRTMFHRRVLPFLCAHPRNAATQDVSDLMPAEIFSRQTQAVRQYADGWVLWGWMAWQLSPPHVAAIKSVLL
jgi:hypothetical protein